MTTQLGGGFPSGVHTAEFQSMFGALLRGNLNLEAPPGENTAIDITLLRNQLPGKNRVVSNVFSKKLSTWEGSWESVFAPLSAMSLREEVRTTYYPLHTMDQSPENAPARNIIHSSQSIQYDMQHHNLQAEFSNSALMDEETALIEVPNAMEVLVSAGIAALKNVIAQQLLESPVIWSNRRQRGNVTGHTNIIEATTSELNTAFIFSRDVLNGLQVTHIAMVAIGLTENNNFNAVVFPEHTYKKVLLQNQNTVFAQSGAKNDTMVANAVQIESSSIINGLTVYSDKLKFFANNPQIGVNTFAAIKQYGQYYLLNNTDTSRLICTDCSEGIKQQTILVPNAETDNWMELNTWKLANLDMRYDIYGDRKLTAAHQNVLRHLTIAQVRTGIQDTSNYIGPFFWNAKVPTLGPDSKPIGHSYRVIQAWGDADFRSWTLEQNSDFGQIVRDRMLKEGILTSEGQNAIHKLKGIFDELNNFDATSVQVQSYFAALKSNPENHPIEGGYLKANSFGGVQPPRYDPTNRAYYNSSAGQDTYPVGIRIVDDDLAMGTKGTLVAFPFVTKVVYISDLVQQGGAVDRDLIAADDTLGNNITKNALMGNPVYVPQNVGFPVPYGMGNINGLLTLQRMLRGGDFRGYSRELLVDIDAGLRALITVVKYIFAIVPVNMFTDPENVPFFMKTNNDEMNAVNTAIASIFLGMPHPIMTRSTLNQTTVDFGRGQHLANRSNEQGYANNEVIINMGFNVINPPTDKTEEPLDLWLPRQENAAAPEDIRNEVELLGVIADLFKNRNLSSLARNALINEGQEVFRIWEQTIGKSYESMVREGLVNITTPIGNTMTNNYRKFAWFFREEIFKPSLNHQKEGLAELMSAVIGLLKGNPEDVNLSRSYINTLKIGASSLKSRKRNLEIQESVTSAIGTDSEIWDSHPLNQWVNTRLTSSKDVWREIHNGLENNIQNYSEFYNSNIRPSDPLNSSIALAGGVFKVAAFSDRSFTVDGNLNEKTFENLLIGVGGALGNAPKLSFNVLQYSQARRSRRTGIFEEFGLTRGPISSSQKTMKTNEIEPGIKRRIDELQYGGENEFLPDTILSKDLIEIIPYEDRYGRETNEMPGIAIRENLLMRFQHLHESIHDPIAQMAAIIQVAAEAHFDNVEAAAKKGFPFFGDSFSVNTPWIQELGGHGCWFNRTTPPAKAGFLYDHAAFQLSAEYKKWLLHLDGWFGCTIIDEHGFLITPFALDCLKYISGWDFKFWKNPEEFDPENIDLTNSPSTFVFNLGSNVTCENFSDPMTLDGLYHPDNFIYQSFNNNRVKFGRNSPVFTSALFYTDLWGFDMITKRGPKISNFGQMESEQYINTIMYRGNERHWNTSTKDFSLEKIGTSHFRGFPGSNFRATLDGAAIWHTPSAISVRTVNSTV